MRRIRLLPLLAALLCLTGCGERPTAPPEAEAPAVPQRIICMAPSVAEAVFALGAGDRVVGVSNYTRYPPEAEKLPKVGALYNPDLERIVALQPDLMIVQQKHAKVEALCAKRNIPVLRVRMTTVANILGQLRLLGDRLDTRQRAEALCKEITADLAAVRARVACRPRPKVFFCVDRQPGTLKGLFSVGGTSFLTEMLDVAGADNVFADVEQDYFQPTSEALLARAPDVIIETRPSQAYTGKALAELTAPWRKFADLPAVKNQRIHVVTDNFIVLPGPRVARIAERLAEVIHGLEPHER